MLERDYTTESIKLQANAHLGSGLIGGSVAGVEYDENGNLSFDPAKFALGFLGGAGGSKGIERITRLAKYPKARAAMERVRLKKDIMPKMQQGQRVANVENLQGVFLDSNDRIDETALNNYAKPLPQMLDKESFLHQITQKDSKGYSSINTPIGTIQVNLAHAWNHLHKGNTYKKDRSLYSGAFLDTLTDPLFIVKQEYIPNPKVSANAREMQNSKLVQTRDGESIAQDSYVFFKPYKIKGSKDFGRIKKMFSAEVLYVREAKEH